MKLWSCCLALISSLSLQAQKKEIYLRPYLGLQTGFWTNLSKPVEVDTRRNFINVEGDIGLTLEVKVNKRFGYNAGIYAGLAASGYGFLLRTDCRQIGFSTHWSAATYSRLGIGLDYIISRKDFLHKKKTLVIAVSGGPGLMIRANEDLNGGQLGSFSSDDACGNKVVGKKHFDYHIRTLSATLWLRPSLRLYVKGKEKAGFSFLFNQGLTTCYDEDITYEYNGTPHIFTNRTRGTSFGFNLSWPILIRKAKPAPSPVSNP